MKIYDASGFDSKLTGSFTGSFYGDGSNLTGIVTYTKAEISGSSTLVSASLAASISNILDGTSTVASASTAITASFALNAGAGTGFPFSGSADITGSLYVSGGNISGSFVGDGSGLTGIVIEQSTIISASFTNANEYTASHNLNTEQVLINTYFDDGTQFIPQEVKVLSDSAVALKFNTPTSGRVVIAKAGHLVTGASLISENTVSDTFTNVSQKTVLHNFNTKDVFVSVFLDDDTQIIPSEVKTINENNVRVTLDQSRSGRIVVGKAGHIISGSTAVVESSTVTDTFTNVATTTVSHGFNTKDILVNVYTSDDEMIIPSSINTISSGSVRVTFDTPKTGRVVVAKGGHIVTGTAESVAFANILNKPALVSGSLDFDNITNKPTLISSSIPPFPHTGSAIISGSLRVIGSVTADTYIVSSSITYTTQSFSSGSTIFGNSLDDTHLFTGSVDITGSLTVAGGINDYVDLEEGIRTGSSYIPSTPYTHTYVSDWWGGGLDTSWFNITHGGVAIGEGVSWSGTSLKGHGTSTNSFFSRGGGTTNGGTTHDNYTYGSDNAVIYVDDSNWGIYSLDSHGGTAATNVTLVDSQGVTPSYGDSVTVGVVGNTYPTPVSLKGVKINGYLDVTGNAYVTSSKVYNNNTSSGSLSFWQGSQTEYDAISSSADPNTFYIIRS